MRNMFNNCRILRSLPDISKWNTNKVTDMSGIFSSCDSLSSLPDISNWNTHNVINMNKIFLHVIHYHHYHIFQNGILIMLLT